MRKLLATLTPVALALALCANASAQSNKDKSKDQDNANQNRPAGETQTIRGVIAGVTLEGETAVDFRTGRAVEVETAYLTIVGSPRRDRDRERGERAGESGRNRHNIYVVWLTPRTWVRDATHRDNKEASASID